MFEDGICLRHWGKTRAQNLGILSCSVTLLDLLSYCYSPVASIWIPDYVYLFGYFWIVINTAPEQRAALPAAANGVC